MTGIGQVGPTSMPGGSTPGGRPSAPAGCRSREHGFTLLELVLVMGMLAGFLGMLVQILSAGTSLYSEGEAGQEMADRARTTRHRIRDGLADIAGPKQPVGDGAGANRPSSRMVLQRLQLPADPAREALRGGKVPFLRVTVAIDKATEADLVRPALRDALIQSGAAYNDEDAEVARLLAGYPYTGRGTLLVWVDREAEPGFLQLRRLLLPAGQTIALDPEGEEQADPMDLPLPFVEEPGWEQLRALSAPWCTRLLHLDLEVLDPTSKDPNVLRWVGEWDTARAGWFLDVKDTAFEYDLGPDSLADTRDDLWPRSLRVSAVVGRPAEAAPKTRLARDLNAGDGELTLLRSDVLPPENDTNGGWIKVDDEWIRYSSISGRTLRGLKRGQRGTQAADHSRGAPARTGREVRFSMPLHAGRGDAQ